jgi:DNA-binding CsgD family transcriptional regulator
MAQFDKAKASLDYNRAIQSKLAEILEPLQLIGISNFAYVKITQDDQFRIGNHEGYTNKWYELEIYNKAATLNRLAENHRDGDAVRINSYLWNTDGNSLAQVRREVNMWNGASLYTNHGDYLEGWSLGGTLEDTQLSHLIINNLCLINKFMHYFRSAASDLISLEDRSVLLDLVKADQDQTQGEAKKLEEFARRIELHKYFLKNGNQEFTISSREMECLRQKDMGLSAKEMARVMGISYRTVESYFENIKIKSGLGNVSQVLAICRDEGLL